MFLYYALFDFDSDGITISFPDLEGAYSARADMQDALYGKRPLGKLDFTSKRSWRAHSPCL